MTVAWVLNSLHQNAFGLGRKRIFVVFRASNLSSGFKLRPIFVKRSAKCQLHCVSWTVIGSLVVC